MHARSGGASGRLHPNWHSHLVMVEFGACCSVVLAGCGVEAEYAGVGGALCPLGSVGGGDPCSGLFWAEDGGRVFTGGSPAAFRLSALLAWVAARHAFVAATIEAADTVKCIVVKYEGPAWGCVVE